MVTRIFLSSLLFSLALALPEVTLAEPNTNAVSASTVETNKAPETVAPPITPAPSPAGTTETQTDPVRPDPPLTRGSTYQPYERKSDEEDIWAALGEDPEFEVLFYMVPVADDDNFDIPYGFEIGLQSWIDETYGARLTMGYQRWAVGGDSLNYYGVAQVLPLGLGLMVAIPEETDWFDLRFDLGVSLKIVSGDLSYGGIELDYGNAIGANAGLTADIRYWEDWPLVLGLGYQLDISSSSPGSSASDNDFSQQGVYMTAGIRRRL